MVMYYCHLYLWDSLWGLVSAECHSWDTVKCTDIWYFRFAPVIPQTDMPPCPWNARMHQFPFWFIPPTSVKRARAAFLLMWILMQLKFVCKMGRLLCFVLGQPVTPRWLWSNPTVRLLSLSSLFSSHSPLYWHFAVLDRLFVYKVDSYIHLIIKLFM